MTQHRRFMLHGGLFAALVALVIPAACAIKDDAPPHPRAAEAGLAAGAPRLAALPHAASPPPLKDVVPPSPVPPSPAPPPQFDVADLTQPQKLAPADAAAGFSTVPADGEAPLGGDAGFVLDAAARSLSRSRSAFAMLQIGDSHTAADYFTGEVRREVQRLYGNGGAGYLEAGTPRPGVQTTSLSVQADPGWSYAGIQQSSDPERFAISGFLAETSKAGQSLRFTASDGMPYTDIDIEARMGPGQGAIDVSIDGRLAKHLSLEADHAKNDVVHLPSRSSVGYFRHIEIKTTADRPVTLLSVGLFNKKEGVTYSNIGFPGATIDILNKFPQATIIEALNRLEPRVVVLSFGTNEGFNDNLDLVRYRDRYLNVIRIIRMGAPQAKIVMIGPSFANRIPQDCKKNPEARGCKPQPGDGATGSLAARDDRQGCPYPTPPQLDRVRSLQRDIAVSEGIAFWDWSAIMPRHCGAEAWVSAVPPLMTHDHVHFTKDGYRRGGQAFAAYLEKIIGTASRDLHAVSNH
jgi:lysophospholipase L1-like esterase